MNEWIFSCIWLLLVVIVYFLVRVIMEGPFKGVNFVGQHATSRQLICSIPTRIYLQID